MREMNITMRRKTTTQTVYPAEEGVVTRVLRDSARQLRRTQLLVRPRPLGLPDPLPCTLNTSKGQKQLASEVRQPRVQVLALFLTNGVIPGKVPNVSDTPLPQL